MKLLLAGILAAATVLGAAPAHADPGSDCGLHDPRLCGDPSKIYYCPSTHGMVTWLQPCPALVLGPYGPGNPSPS
jgi:hypothetical protein